MSTDQSTGSRWMRHLLVAAAWYNVAWGLVVILLPDLLFWLADMPPPRYPQIWQCVGMIVGVYGVGYWIASRDPLRHWPIVLVGLLGKIFGPIGFAQAVISGQLPLAFGATILTNDLVWWLPFVAILFQAYKHHSGRIAADSLPFNEATATIRSHRGATLLDLSRQRPTLVVFLRDTGCTFCRQALADLARRVRAIEAQGITVALVHMSDPLHATQFLARYQLDMIHRFSDPTCRMYRAFGLPRARFGQLFGYRVLLGWVAGLLHGHGMGQRCGDGFQLAGSYLLGGGAILWAYQTQSAADPIRYPQFACNTSTNHKYTNTKRKRVSPLSAIQARSASE